MINKYIECSYNPNDKNKITACRDTLKKPKFKPWCKNCRTFNNKKPFTRKRGVRNGL